MADIVQLHENGIFKYLKTHVKAVEGLEEELLKKENKQKNVGWLELPLLNGFQGGASIRQVGSIVQFTGFLKSSAPNGNLNAIAFRIPDAIDIGKSTYPIPLFLPEGEMNGSGAVLGMTGFIKPSERTLTIWHKNVVGDCGLDGISLPAR